MKELSLNILDITENSVKAKASLTKIEITEDGGSLVITVTDDGTGMTKETLNAVTNPFYTTRTTRKVGLGIPLFKAAAEQTGGKIEINSHHISEFPDSHGTRISASFDKTHIDCPPLGDVISTVVTLIQGHPDTDFLFIHRIDGFEISLDTREMRAILDGVALNSFEVLEWVEDNLSEQYLLSRENSNQ